MTSKGKGEGVNDNVNVIITCFCFEKHPLLSQTNKKTQKAYSVVV